MTVEELIELLQMLPKHLDVMLHDGIGPRTCGAPMRYTITQDDAESVGDCEAREGEQVVIIYTD